MERVGKRHSKMGNNKGSITIDFIFALVLVAGLAGIIWSTSLTLTVSSITQYLTFAAARNLNASHHDSSRQGELANIKFQALVEHQVLKPLYSGGWFELQNPAFYGKPGHLQQQRPEFQYNGQNPQTPDLFVGYAVTFVARILDFKIPFYGSTTDEGDGSGEGFRTEVGSFLSKEPSAQQCLRFNKARWAAIRQLTVDTQYAPYSSFTSDSPDNNFGAYGDNGC